MRRLFRLCRCRAAAGAAGAHGGGIPDMAPVEFPGNSAGYCWKPRKSRVESIKLGNINGLYRFMMFYVFVGLFFEQRGAENQP